MPCEGLALGAFEARVRLPGAKFFKLKLPVSLFGVDQLLACEAAASLSVCAPLWMPSSGSSKTLDKPPGTHDN